MFREITPSMKNKSKFSLRQITFLLSLHFTPAKMYEKPEKKVTTKGFEMNKFVWRVTKYHKTKLFAVFVGEK